MGFGWGVGGLGGEGGRGGGGGGGGPATAAGYRSTRYPFRAIKNSALGTLLSGSLDLDLNAPDLQPRRIKRVYETPRP